MNRSLIALALLAAGSAVRAAEPVPAELAAPAEQFQRSCERSLLPGLKRSQNAITLREFDSVLRLAKDKRVKDIVYFNRSGDVRWSKDAALWPEALEQYRKHAAPWAASLDAALKARAAVIVAGPKGLYEIAMPLVSEGQLQGVLEIQTDSKGLRGLGADAQRTLKRDAPVKLPVRTAPPPKDEARQRSAQQHYLAGLTAYQKGEAVKARQEWTVSLQLDPGNPDLPAALKRVKDAK